MTNEKNHQGRGGSTVVKDGKVERSGGGLNPSDRGYAEAVRKHPIESASLPGTLHRVPSHADLVEEPAANPKPASSRSGLDAAAFESTSKPKGDK